MGIKRIEFFLGRIKNALPEQYDAICTEEVDYLRPQYALSSLRRTLTDYRKAVNSSMAEELVDRINCFLTLTRDEAKIMASLKNKQISKDLKNLRPINDLDKHIVNAVAMLDGTSHHIKIVGLAALTGRRMAEIGCTAKFEKIEGDDNHVLFTGQLKMKGRPDQSAYIIPVLGDVDKIINTLDYIRKNKPVYIDNTHRFHNACSKELGERVRKHFPDTSDDHLTPKDLRAIYAEICYELEDNKTIAKQKFFSEILGHGEDDNATGISYLDFYIAD
jgi:integrase